MTSFFTRAAVGVAACLRLQPEKQSARERKIARERESMLACRVNKIPNHEYWNVVQAFTAFGSINKRAQATLRARITNARNALSELRMQTAVVFNGLK